jgi:cyanophycinase-like exopeptidase
MYLFADSQLLFWRRDNGELVLEETVRALPNADRRAAYLGASNGDDPQFYSIFESAMDALGISQRRMIHSNPSTEATEYLRSCRLILLAGGDVLRGWRTFIRTGVGEIIVRCYRQGSVLIGVSAGAVQLGQGGPFDSATTSSKSAGSGPLRTFGLVPQWVDVHDEKNQWRRLRSFLSTCEKGACGLGLPFGSGVMFHPGGSMRAIKSPIQQFVRTESDVNEDSVPPVSE